MPRFYFDIRVEGAFTEDEDGAELPDVGAAEEEAVACVSQLAWDKFPHSDIREISVEVRGEYGGRVLAAKISLVVER